MPQYQVRKAFVWMFLIAALNDLNVVMTDIGNANLNMKVREKIWSTAGPEFREDNSAVVLIVQALYRLKSSGTAWRAHFAQSLHMNLVLEVTPMSGGNP